MVNFIGRRLIQTIFVIFAVTVITFLLIQLTPGDPAVNMLGSNAPKEQIEALRRELWLDRPVYVQYGHWLLNVLHGDLGRSLTFRENVTDLIARRLPVTAYLAFLALILGTFMGISAGIFTAIRRGTILDSMITLFANIGIAVPVFWLGILLIYFLGLRLGWLPIQGYTSPFTDFWKSSAQLVMPVICLATPGLAVIARQTRSSMLEVVGQDYIRTAMAKGLRERVVVLKHALKNALIPVVTLLGLQVRVFIGGSVLVETVSNVPGMGRLLVTAAFNKDFLVVQAGVLVLALVVCLANLAVDVSYSWLDPRIRYE